MVGRKEKLKGGRRLGKLGILKKIKEFIGEIAFLVLLWSNDMTEIEYWRMIYEQEKSRDMINSYD
jgi:hypothetical protein